MSVHIIEDASTGEKCGIDLFVDKHGLVIHLPDKQVIVLDYNNATFSIYRYDHDQTDEEECIGRVILK